MPKKIKGGAFEINLDEYADVGTHWTDLYVKNIGTICFDSLGVFGYKSIKTNIFRLQSNNSVIGEYFSLDSLILCLQVKL